MKKMCVKIFIITLIIITFVNCNFSYSIKTGFGELTVTDKSVLTTEATNVFNNVIHVVSLTGSGISVIALIVLGIKYMMGSLEEKAQYKKTLLPYVIGACLVFGASVITSILYNIFHLISF